jgi:hypothetical protein
MRALAPFLLLLVAATSVHGLPDVSQGGSAECEGYTFVYGGTQPVSQLLVVSPSLVAETFNSDALRDDFVLAPAVACVRANETEWRVFVHGGLRRGTASRVTLQLDVDLANGNFSVRHLNTTGSPASTGGFLEVEPNGNLLFLGGDCPGETMDSGLAAFELVGSAWSERPFALKSGVFPHCGAAVARVGGAWWFVGGQSTDRARAPLVARVDLDTLEASVLQDIDQGAAPWTSPPLIVHTGADPVTELFILGGGAPLHTLSLDSGGLTMGGEAASPQRPHPYLVRPRTGELAGTLVCGGMDAVGAVTNAVCDFVDDASFFAGPHEPDEGASVLQKPYLEASRPTDIPIAEDDGDEEGTGKDKWEEVDVDKVYADLPEL